MRFPHNTMEGIAAAATYCDMVEVDTRRSRDGVAVLSHDAVLAGRLIVETDWEELARLDVGDGLHPARLDEVRAEAGGVPLNVEIKNHPTDPDFDEEFGFPLYVGTLAGPDDLVTSFHWPTVDAVRAARPELDTGLLVGLDGSLDDAASWALTNGHGVVAAHWWLLGGSPSDRMTRLAAAGLRVVVWTVDDGNTARLVADAGAHGIITDDPQRIRTAIEEAL